MPNWCYNYVSFEHDDPAMIAKLIEAAKDNLFNAFVPMPEELRNTQSPSEPDDVLIEKYGASDWYSWSVNNWGTKWDTSAADCNPYEDGKGVDMYFETAWSPPIAFFDAMVAQGFRVNSSYTEEGMGFAGVYNNGDDQCIDLSTLYDAGDEAQGIIDAIEDDDLRIIVQEEYDRYKEWENE